MAADLRQGSELAGFRIESVLGRGGMGVVYRATQVSLQRVVALKLIAPELAAEEAFRERFWREARMAASLEHPHVLPVYEVGEVEGELYLALRYVEGVDLRAMLRQGPLAAERTVRIVTQLCSALEAAHARGLLHRDVKPENVLVLGSEGSEHAYLTDFGLARPQHERGLTKTGELFGSIDYLAPELIEGGEASPRSDVYALGCLLYACLTGRPPFVREQEAATLWAHLRDPPPLPSEVRPELGERFDAVVERALGKDPEERFQSADELADALLAEVPLRRLARGPAAPTNLPRPASSFVGRERELTEVLGRLEAGARLLTLTGPGGSGKTRLALEAASSVVSVYEGVYWVGLASLRDPALVSETIAQVLGAKDGLAEHVGEQRLLLLLDNLEHVIEAAPELAGLVAACPNLTLLVTSRELLRVQGEVEYAVPPLASPEAVTLFCERSGLAPDEDISELCARLDNLPLAVELAAARTKALTPGQILERLSQRLDLLKGGRDAEVRQQTLRATIEWSYELLIHEEQQLFARLSVFAGGCTLEAAEEVCEADLDTLQSLVEKSLLRFSDGRYWMLETIQEYATQVLGSDARRISARHAEFFADLSVGLQPALHYAAGRAAREHAAQRLGADMDNVRKALQHFCEWGTSARALEIAGAVAYLWRTQARFRESRMWLERALEATNADPELRAQALVHLGYVANVQGDYPTASTALEEALRLYRSLGSVAGVGRSLTNLGYLATERGAFDEGVSWFEEAIRHFSESGNEDAAVDVGELLAAPLAHLGDYKRAKALIAASMEQSRQAGDEVSEAVALMNMSEVVLLEGDYSRAEELLHRGLVVTYGTEEFEMALRSLDLSWLIAARAGDYDRAAFLMGAAERHRDDAGYALGAHAKQQAQEAMMSIRRTVGDDAFDASWGRGRDATFDEAIAVALRRSRVGASP